MRPFSSFKSSSTVHLVFKSRNSEPWTKSRTDKLSDVWDSLLATLKAHGQTGKLVPHSLVLMRNHGHLLVSSPSPLEIELLKQALSSQLDLDSLHEEPILSFPQYKLTYKYVYFNPIEAGVVARAQDYPFSSLRMLLGMPPAVSTPEGPAMKVLCPFVDNMNLVSDPIRTLNWINAGPNSIPAPSEKRFGK